MIIRKLFEIKNAHIVRNCSSTRCKNSLHAHTYEIEVFFESDKLDNGMMVLDFGLTKGTLKDLINSFNNTYSFWYKESSSFKEPIVKNIKRWVQMPVSPSAEAYSLLFLFLIDKLIKNTQFNNGEGKISVHSVRVHETRTGYAESFLTDLNSDKMPKFNLSDIVFSNDICDSWNNQDLYDNMINNVKFINPIVNQQV